MPRIKDDEARFRRTLAATGKHIEDVDPLEIGKRAKVNPRRARHFARKIAGPRLPAAPAAVPPKKGQPDGDVQG